MMDPHRNKETISALNSFPDFQNIIRRCILFYNFKPQYTAGSAMKRILKTAHPGLSTEDDKLLNTEATRQAVGNEGFEFVAQYFVRKMV
jgi:hypothetical protein